MALTIPGYAPKLVRTSWAPSLKIEEYPNKHVIGRNSRRVLWLTNHLPRVHAVSHVDHEKS